jgi:hypothetical protein
MLRHWMPLQPTYCLGSKPSRFCRTLSYFVVFVYLLTGCIDAFLPPTGRKEAQIVRLRAELEDAQRLRVDVDELRQYCRQLEAESGRWKCRSCTFINQARNASCEMCNVPNSAATGGAVGGSGDYAAGGADRGARSYSHQSPRSGGSAQDYGIVGLPPR